MMQMLTLWYLQERKFFNGDKNYFITQFKKFQQKKFINSFDSYNNFLNYFFQKISSNLEDMYVNDSNIGKCVVIGPAIFINGEDYSDRLELPNEVFYKKGLTESLINLSPSGKRQILTDNDVPFDVPLLNLFESRDWTEGNIDEFVLGALYEKLINYDIKKKTGAYYTPEEITSYISKKTIEPYLIDKYNSNFDSNYKSISQIIDQSDKKNIIYLYESLKSIKILDPAVGSAHFLESAIEVLISIYEKIWIKAKKLNLSDGLKITIIKDDGKIDKIDLVDINEDKFKLYLKFFIILSKNIYGVDINRSALKVAKARLFLSLAKHFDISKDHFVRFPNVHFNLRPGNSLFGFTNFNEDNAQVGLEYFKNFNTQSYVKKSIKIVCELKEYLNSSANSLGIKGDIIEKVEKLNRILSMDEISSNNFKFVLKVKENLIQILIVSLNSEFARPLNELINDITTLFKIKIDENFAEEYNINVIDLDYIQTFHWIFEFPEVFLQNKGFDVVIGNPPWDKVKAYDKEFFSKYDSRITKELPNQDTKKIIQELKQDENILNEWKNYDRLIKVEKEFYNSNTIYNHQKSQMFDSFTRSDHDYYKLFLERSNQLLQPEGYLGILVPSGIHTDAGTKGLRELFFENCQVKELYSFENKKGIFKDVHKSFKFVLFIVKKDGNTAKFNCAFMMHDIELLKQMPDAALNLDWSMFEKFAPESKSIIEFNSIEDINITKKLHETPLIMNNKWLGNVQLNREFDMTNDSNLFNTEGDGLVLYEGKMIEQYDPYFENNRFWVEEQLGIERLYNSSNINYDLNEFRIGFRDVGSSTNRRSMIASILPKNIFCGNTLIVPRIFDGEDRLIEEKKLLYLNGVFNSFVFDYLIRMKISNHLNFFFVYQSPIPIPDESSFDIIVKNIIKLTEKLPAFNDLRIAYKINGNNLNQKERLKLIAEIDWLVGKSYGINKSEMIHILDKFHHNDSKTEKEIRKLEELILEYYD